MFGSADMNLEMERDLELKLRRSSEMDFRSSPETPWMSTLSPTMVSHVSGFVSFLEMHAQKNCGNVVETCEIQKKIDQLNSWKNAATQILENPNKDYIDSFALASDTFNIFQTRLSGKVVKVIYALEQEEISLEEHVTNLRRFPSDDSEEEGKTSEGVFRSSGVNESVACIEIEGYPIGQCVLKSGFVFEKCLRRVEKSTENREVFTAFRCEFNEVSGRIIKIFPSDKYIIKRVCKTGNGYFDERLRREFKVQTLLSQFKHKNINEIVHYFEDQRNIISVSKSAGNIDMLDYLANFVKDHQTGVPEPAIRKFFRGVAEGLLVAHNVGIAHRDMSLENLVLNNFQAHNEVIEIIDWGHSVATGLQSTMIPHEGALGKVRYMSPELALQNGGEYDPMKADVFSFGVCLFCMLTGQMPFSNINDGRGMILKQSATNLVDYVNEKAKKKVLLSAEAHDLLNNTLKWNPNERCTMREVLNHPFFAV